MSSSHAIIIPDLNETQSLWLPTLNVQEGQAIEAGQVLARVEGKRSSQELISPAQGYIVGLHAIPGQTVDTGQVLCYVCAQPSISASYGHPASLITFDRPAMDPTALLIFGGGGHGKAVIDLIRALGAYRIVGIIDDGLPAGSDVLDIPVLGGSAVLGEWYARGIRMAVNAVGGIGNVAVRLKIFDMLAKAHFTCPTLVHPSAVIERSAHLDAGVQVLAQAYVGSAARVGFGTVLNAGVILSHDCNIGQVVNLSPGATLAGNVRVEDQVQIGMRATVNLGLVVGKGSLLGNGCTVKANVPPDTRVRAGTIWPVRA